MTALPAPPAPARPPRPPLRRAVDGRWVAGVARGLALHLGVDPWVIRAAFVLAAFSGAGVIAYAAFWAVVPLDAEPSRSPTQARGLRPAPYGAGERPAPPADADAGEERRDLIGLLGLAAVSVGVLLLLRQAGLEVAGAVVPFVVAATGVAVLWRLADDAQRRRVVEATAGLAQPVGEGAPRWAGWARLLLGVALLVVGAVVFFASRGGIGAATTAVLAVLVALAGVLVVAGPWLYRLVRELADERAERIRSQERADLAAHVHDSVLQTLTLIQRRSDDPREVVRLARAEERALRQWLYQPAAERSDSVSGALDRLAAEVEDDHGATLEVVCVGDASVDERLEALLQAAREAMVNAAKYAAAGGPVSVYAEVEPHEVSVYVRDRGPGFELAAIPADRMGVRESIIGRMERAGGRAEVRTSPGEGCEVRLSMPRGEEDQ